MDSLRTKIRNILFENLEPITKFTTKIENSNVVDVDFQMSSIGLKYGLETKEEHEEVYNLIVDWTFETDAREWGIKDFQIDIKNVRGTILIKPDPYDKPNEKINIDFDANQAQFKIENEMEIKNNSSVYPSEIYINFKRKEIRVS